MQILISIRLAGANSMDRSRRNLWMRRSLSQQLSCLRKTFVSPPFVQQKHGFANLDLLPLPYLFESVLLRRVIGLWASPHLLTTSTIVERIQGGKPRAKLEREMPSRTSSERASSKDSRDSHIWSGAHRTQLAARKTEIKINVYDLLPVCQS
jgi:hypothetical protein